MARIFLVNHPHKEPGYGRVSIGSAATASWNVSQRHHRKFMKCCGQYILNQKLLKNDLYFWGEYEPMSDYIIIDKNKPKAVHYNMHPVRGRVQIPANAHNTDPYVFGNHFKYICCGMRRYNYDPGDVVLFGKIEQNNSGIFTFLLDTVFVVKEKVQINFSLNTTQYYNASIKPLKKNKQYFYKGKNYNEDNLYYSFVPCRLDSSVTNLPKLNLNNLGFNVKKAYSWVAKPITFNNNIWNEILAEVKNSGWMRGVHLRKI